MFYEPGLLRDENVVGGDMRFHDFKQDFFINLA